MRTCSSCGKGIADNTKYCPFCGAPCSDGAAEQTYEQQQDPAGPYMAGAGGSQTYNSTGRSNANGLSIAGLILGILAIVFAFIPGVSFIAWICGVVGIIISAVAISQSKSLGQKNGIAVAGLVLSIIAIALGLIVFMVACGIAGCAASARYW